MNISEAQEDALKEIINIGVGRAAKLLNDMLDTHIALTVPDIKVGTYEEIKDNVKVFEVNVISSVELKFSGYLNGKACLVFPPDSASKIVSLLSGEESEDDDLNTISAGTLCEVGNILLNSVMGTIVNTFKETLNYSIPELSECEWSNIYCLKSDEDENLVLIIAQTNFTVESLNIEGMMLIVFKLGSFDSLLQAIDKMI